ncbi:hypothetical protein ScPMuIL_003436 [Solemya velum]
MNSSLLLMALLMALLLGYCLAGSSKIRDAEQKEIYGRCRDELSKCRKSASRSSKKHVHYMGLLMCQLKWKECVSLIWPSLLETLK